MKHLVLWSASLLALAGCDRLASIPYSPPQTPESWLKIQPFMTVKLGSNAFILVQPSSTVFVYLLGLITAGLGLGFLAACSRHLSRRWWAAALLLWGLGAVCAGTSYQAFSYEIKCAGRALCSWTSWWEIVYLLLSAASVDAMMVAEAYACSRGKWRWAMVAYALTNLVVYITMILAGAFSLTRFLISFELLLVIAAPSIFFFFCLNGWRYARFKGSMDRALLVTWIWLGVTLAAYFIYLELGITAQLWASGIWFSENDVLHIGLIGWMVYIAINVAGRVVDAPALEV